MVDVTIRGAGIFGLSIAWTCARRGASVQVVDPNGPASGASGGIVGALAPHVPENWNTKKAFQLESLLMAPDFWQDVEATGGVTAGYGRTGRLQPIADERALDLAQRRAVNAESLWQGQAVWTVRHAADLGPFAPSSATGQVIHDTLSARIHPRRACAALVAALGVRGVPILADAPDRGQIVHATGVDGLADLSHARGKSVGVGVKGQAALLRFDAGEDAPQLFVDGLHLIPHADGTLAIGSTSERDYDDARTTDALLDDVIERAVAAMPILHGVAVIERWAGIRPRAKSRAPMLGRWPDRPDHFIANGGFKIGFGMAPKVAQVMADLLLDGQDAIPEGFRVEASL
ncbi:NAD(P)/FAD-dependent oxidoreductase [Sedimentitalea todarodis]|uniref:FAD-dependent oxidoreductase n=1 Tax=Sedimentitalea todarodis TaxID=1631240 RepID=A0ABU3VD34_9RHOB|nr:FAD-dependent oxidoreductase [Sedimentitalea todarodis]MDU9004087.1 FAD-dependent oxidoreductase [Sedimentitalea todarodis]